MTVRRPPRPSPAVGRRGLAATALLLLASCLPRPADVPGVGDGRLDTLARAFAVRDQDPARAAELFADAGFGSVLERARLEAWLDALERADADETAWRRLLRDRIPVDVEARAMLALARRLAAHQRLDDAAAVLAEVPQPRRAAADLELLRLGDGPWRAAAATRLAVSSPAALRREAPGLERAAVAVLDVDARLARSAAWRDSGAAGRAVAELRRERWRGEADRLRRLELARAELAAGSPTRAIAALRGLPENDVDAELVRAQAYRRQGWQRSPQPSARGSFAACVDHGARSASVAAVGGSTQTAALTLVVECGTEAGRLDEALTAWWRVEGAGGAGDRREWLGRRLGVALAQAGGRRREVEQLAGSLSDHERCLRFWLAVGARPSGSDLDDLGEPVFADLYGLWARELTGSLRAGGAELPPAIEPTAPPWSAAWLLERGLAAEAAAEWSRVRRARGTEPAEGIAEAALAEQLGQRNQAIRILREAVPELGTVAMATAPANAIRAYLPLPWIDEVRSAAAEFGLDPWLVAGVARQESAFVPHARSPRGAVGLMQLLPSTARGHGLALGIGSRPDLGQPEVNLRLGARELRRLLDRFEALEVALAAYNAGETRARRWQREQPNRFRFTEEIPIPETYGYVRRVRFLAEAYRVAYDREWRRSP